jgi:hypothetical protein
MPGYSLPRVAVTAVFGFGREKMLVTQTQKLIVVDFFLGAGKDRLFLQAFAPVSIR